MNQEESLLFYPSGKIKGRSFYLNGLLDGLSEFFSSEGMLVSSTFFVQGKAHGVSKQFYLTGAPYAILFYEMGKFQGKQAYFYEKGAKKTELFYDKGLLDGRALLFWANGFLKREIDYQFGLKNGWDRVFSEQGILLDAGEFALGEPINTHTRYYLNGAVREQKIYKTRSQIDTRKWDIKGDLQYEGLYVAENKFQETRFKGSEKQVRIGTWNGQHVQWE